MSETRAKRRLPLSEPIFGGRELEYVRECLASGWVSSAGPKVQEFERAVADYVGATHAVACVNGTSAIHLALLAAGVGRGDEVLMPSLTFVGSVNPVLYIGAIPVLADVDPATLTISPAAVERILAERYRRSRGGWRSDDGRRLAAILVVDLYGHPVDYEPLHAVANRYQVPLVEDAAEAIGASCRSRRAGRLADVAVLSFNGNKVITTGGGGMVLTDDPDLAARARHLSTQARSDAVEYVHDAVGYNYRLSNLQAAIGLAQLEQLDLFLAAKRVLHERYRQSLAQFDGVEVISEQTWARSSFWLVSVLIDSLAASRDRVRDLVRRMNADGIEVRPFFTPIHHQRTFPAVTPEPLTATDHAFARGINLPSSASLQPDDADTVVEFLARHAGLTQVR